MLADTHVHVDGLMAGGNDVRAIVDRAVAGGVGRMVAVGGSMAANRTAMGVARAFPERIRAAVGYNRDRAAAGDPLGELEAMLAAPEAPAVGEIGLDFQRGRDTVAAQVGLFRRMLVLARAHRRPVCVHTRDAEPETLAALQEHAAAWRGPAGRIGVMHCYTGGEAFARDVLALGFMISFSGILTFKNAGALRAVAAGVPENRLLIETDSPYLAPEPYRGRPNEPAYVRRVAEALAELRHTTWEAIADVTFANAAVLFFPGANAP